MLSTSSISPKPDDSELMPNKVNGGTLSSRRKCCQYSGSWYVCDYCDCVHIRLIRAQRVPRWSSAILTPSSIHLQRVSGALTNAVFFVSFNPSPTPTSPSMSPLLTPTLPPSDPEHPTPFLPAEYPPTLLLRIYGPSSDALISREEELRILHVLCTQYGLGPRIYGTFGNGRVEQFFPSRALKADELRDPVVSRAIGRRMRELHSVDLKALGYDEGSRAEAVVWKCLREWVVLAEEVMNPLREIGGRWEVYVETFGLHGLTAQIEKFRQTIGEADAVVFARMSSFLTLKGSD